MISAEVMTGPGRPLELRGFDRPELGCARRCWRSFNPHLDLNQKQLEVRGCWGSDAGHLHRSVQVLARYAKLFRWTDLITREYPLEQAEDALQDVTAQRVGQALIVPARSGEVGPNP